MSSMVWLAPCKGKIRMLVGLCVHLQVLRIYLLPRSFLLLAEFNSLRLFHWSPLSLLAVSGGCSQLPEAAHLLCYVTPTISNQQQRTSHLSNPPSGLNLWLLFWDLLKKIKYSAFKRLIWLGQAHPDNLSILASIDWGP